MTDRSSHTPFYAESAAHQARTHGGDCELLAIAPQFCPEGEQVAPYPGGFSRAVRPATIGESHGLGTSDQALSPVLADQEGHDAQDERNYEIDIVLFEPNTAKRGGGIAHHHHK